MKKKHVFLLAFFLLLTAVVFFLVREGEDFNRQISWGVTFEKDFAKKLGLSWQEVYLSLLDDLGFKKIRLAARWSEIEPEKGIYDFSDLDWQIQEAQKRGVKIILAIGYKLPRWPECHFPSWSNGQPKLILPYIEKTVSRYKDNPAIFAWQIENEPFLPFGECPALDVSLLDEEISLVEKIDSRPIVITDSGELSIWIRAAKRADIFGTTMYRWVWNEYLGSYKYPIGPSFFRAKERIVRFFVGWEKPFWVIELQGELWTHKQIYEITIEEQIKLFSLSELSLTIDYAKRAGFSDYYLWGVEWWYFLKQKNHQEYWDFIKDLVEENQS